MEGEESVGMVLSRVAELRCKITGCIHKATADSEKVAEEEEETLRRLEGMCNGETEGEAESLFSIRDSLDSMEEQLASLQALQEQQQYERESALAEIDQSRRILLKKLKEYKGGNLEVIQEASAFASGTFENGTDPFLLSFPSCLPESMICKSICNPRHLFSNGQLPLRNHVSCNLEDETKLNGSEKLMQPGHKTGEKKPQSMIKTAVGLAVKAALTLVSVVSVLTLARFQPRFPRTVGFKALDLLPRLSQVEENTMSMQCPPGKVLVMEDGVSRCIVKERVEVPFQSAVNTPDVRYGFG